MHVGGKGIENLLMNTMLKKTLLKKHKAKNIFFYASLLENKLNIFQFGIVEMITSRITTYEIKGCLAKIKIRVSNKVTLMNCHH